MELSTKIIILALVVFAVIAAAAANFILVREESLHYSEHTTNAGELVTGTLVGQTFVARADQLSGVAVKFATYSNRHNTQPVEFHLRQSLADAKDIRTATVDAAALGDNQLHRFEFEPIPESFGQTFFFYVTSPASRPGDAVTVDLDTRDPYHEGSAYVVRNEPVSFAAPDVIARSGRQTIDVVFATYHTTSLRAATINSSRQFVRTIIATWDQRQGSYVLWLELAAPVAALFLLLLGLRGKGGSEQLISPHHVRLLLFAILLGGLLFRVLYAVSVPITNDEGNYLYDARTLLVGTLAGGDGYVKAPLVIAWLAAWQFIGGHTILAGRLAMIVASTLLAVPLYFLTKSAFGQRAGLLGAAGWALLGAPAVFGVYVHTQSVALLFGIAGIAALWVGLKQEYPPMKWFIIGGLLLGLGVASRKSILALGLVPLVLVLLMSRSWSDRLYRLLAVGGAFGVIMSAFVFLGVTLYGCDNPRFLIQDSGRCMGVEEALGINSAEDGLTAVTAEEVENVRAYSLRGMTPFFRESLPLIILSLLGWGIVLETTARRLLGRWRDKMSILRLAALRDYLLPKLAWVVPGAAFWWAWWFFAEYEGSVFHEMGGMQWLWWAFAALLVVVAAWPSQSAANKQPLASPHTTGSASPAPSGTATQWSNVVGATGAMSRGAKLTSESLAEFPSFLVASLLPVLWVGGLAVFYMNWIKFHANYIVEFLPPLAVMSGIGAYAGWQRLRGTAEPSRRKLWLRLASPFAAGFFIIVVGWSAYLSNYVTYVFEHTGTFDQGSVAEAAAWAKENIPIEEPLFTGAAVVPYVSGHRVALDIAHPRWYAYEFTRKDTERLETFLPSAEEMLAAFREADWFLLEQQTGFSFLMEYSEIERSLETDWQVVHEVENLSNKLIFYRRVR